MNFRRLSFAFLCCLGSAMAAPFSGSVSLSYFDGSTSVFSVGFGGGNISVLLANPGATSVGSPIDTQCNCLNPSAIAATHAGGGGAVVYFGSSLNPNFDYTATYRFNFEPWTGGTVTNNNAITGAFGNQVIWDYRLSGGTALVSGSFEIRSRTTGECLWCDSFTGTATVSANIGGPQLIPGYQEGRGDYQFQFSGETVATTGVPEPATSGFVGLSVIAGLGLLRSKRKR